MDSRFTVTLYCKPYVKQWLEKNYLNPVNLTLSTELASKFREQLKKPNHKYDNRPDLENSTLYSASVEITISEHDFYHYGWTLTRAGHVKFGKAVEKILKLQVRSAINAHMIIHGRINKAILFVQNHFDLPEDVFSYESMKKDFFRNGSANRFDFAEHLTQEMQNHLLRLLYENGTISIHYYNRYVINQ